MALDILELRAYARAWHANKHAKTKDDMPQGPMAEMLFGIVHELARREKEVR